MSTVDDHDDPTRAVRSAVLAALRAGNGPVDSLARACRACVNALPIEGVVLSMSTASGHREILHASNAVANQLESLQLTLGEGPGFDAIRTRRPAAATDLTGALPAEWPVFTTEATELDVGAIYAFPLQSGALCLGIMQMYRVEPGWFTVRELAATLEIVEMITLAILGFSSTVYGADTSSAWLDELPRNSAVVHQATGMLIAGHALAAADALALLRGHAFATGQSVEELAHDLTTGRVSIESIEF